MPSSHSDRKYGKSHARRVSRGTTERPLRTARIPMQKAQVDIRKSNSTPSTKPEPSLPSTVSLASPSNPTGLCTASPRVPQHLRFKKNKVEQKPDQANCSPLSSPTVASKDQPPAAQTPTKLNASQNYGNYGRLDKNVFGLSPLTPLPAAFHTADNATQPSIPAPDFLSSSTVSNSEMKNQRNPATSFVSEQRSAEVKSTVPHAATGKAADKTSHRRNSTTVIPSALSRKSVPVASSSLSTAALGSIAATSAAASGKPGTREAALQPAPVTKHSSTNLADPSRRQAGDSRNRTRSTANPSELRSPLKGSGSLSSVSKSTTSKPKPHKEKNDPSLAFRSMIAEGTSASAPPKASSASTSKTKQKCPPKLDTPVVVKPEIESEDEHPFSTMTGKRRPDTVEAKAPALSAPAPPKESSLKPRPKKKLPLKRGVATLPLSDSDSEDEPPLSSRISKAYSATAKVKAPTAVAKVKVKVTQTSTLEAGNEKKKARDLGEPQKSEEGRLKRSLPVATAPALPKFKRGKKRAIDEVDGPEASTSKIPDSVSAPPTTTKQAGIAAKLIHIGGDAQPVLHAFGNYDDDADADDLPSIMVAKVSKTAGGAKKRKTENGITSGRPSKKPVAIPSLAVKREIVETPVALLSRNEDLRLPTPPNMTQQIPELQVMPSISTGTTVEKKKKSKGKEKSASSICTLPNNVQQEPATQAQPSMSDQATAGRKSKDKEKSVSSIRKRKSEAALGVDVDEGGKEKAAKKRRTKATEDLPTEAVTAPATVLPRLEVDLAGKLILSPTVDDKRGVLQQTFGVTQEQVPQAPANVVPVPAEPSASAPTPKKRGQPPKASQDNDGSTASTSKARPKKTKAPYVTKFEQPIVKIEGSGTPVIDEELAKAINFGTQKPGPKAGAKKSEFKRYVLAHQKLIVTGDQAYASSGHSDIRWTVPPVEAYPSVSTFGDNASRPLDQEKRLPFAWTSDKQELAAAIPALAKPLNGVASLNVRYPVVVLEENSAAGVLTMDDRYEEGTFRLNLTMIRDFTCPSALLHAIQVPNSKPIAVADPLPSQSLAPTSSKLPIPGLMAMTSELPFARVGDQGASATIPPAPNAESALVDLQLLGPPPAPMANPDEDMDDDGADDELPFALAYPDEPEPLIPPEHQRLENPTAISANSSSMASAPLDPAAALAALHTAPFNGAEFSASLAPNTGGSVPNALTAILNNTTLFSMDEDSVSQAGIAPNGVPQDVAGSSESPVSLTYKIPAHLPLELVAILQSYIASSPVILVASREIIKAVLRVRVEKGCGLPFLGFFKINGVEEEVLPYRPKKEPPDGYAAGRLQWTFSCEWIPSEQELRKTDLSGSASPWWSYPTKGKGRLLDPPVKPLAHNRHSVARSMHPNYTMRNEPSLGRPWSMLPEYATAKRGVGEGFSVKDESLPAGWYCDLCGKLNFQEMMRFRKCDSRACKKCVDNSQRGYAVTLSQIRDPVQKAQLSHPYNVYPASAVEAFVDQWGDGMQTFSYISKADAGVAVKHVFTGNTPALQQEATKLFQDIQTDVPLAKPKGVNVPYFEYRLSKDDWGKAPSCLDLAREVMQYYGNTYGELEAPNIHRLSLSAWVTSGSKRATSPLSCVKDSIVVMFLGSEVILTLTPKSGLPDPPGTKPSSRELKPAAEIESKSTGVLPLEVENGDNNMIEDVSPSSAPAAATLPESADNMIVDATMQDTEDTQMALVDESGDVPLPAPTQTGEPSTVVPKKGKEKPEKRSIVVTMVHGDVLILSGDKFDYSIKRAGTGILLIGERD